MSRLRLIHILFVVIVSSLIGCSSSGGCSDRSSGDDAPLTALRDTLQAIADASRADVGIALITDGGDTLVINNQRKYPLMSVFKLHQAIALCRLFDREHRSLDSIVHIPRAELNPVTWSPMLADYPAGDIDITVRDMLRYTLTHSDNNASNYMFGHLLTVAATDSDIASVIPRDGFRLSYTEAEMSADHALCYRNVTAPLSAAILISRLYTDSIVAGEGGAFIRKTLGECHTGTDRIRAPLADIPGVTVGHKTGSGFRDNGILAAHNDVAYVRLPDGRAYALAVFVKDYRGTEKQAAAVIASVSRAVYDALAPGRRPR